MRKATAFPALLLSCVALVTCGPRQDTQHPPADNRQARVSIDDESHDTDGATAKHHDEPQSSEPDSEIGSAKAEPSAPKISIAEICKKLNGRVAQKCTKKIAELYDSSCRFYQKTPGQCESEIVAVLECQYQAPEEVLCAHEAAQKCLPASRKLKSCQHGTTPVEQTSVEDTTVPDGWEQVHDEQLGFRVALPPGAELEAKSKRRTWRAEANGISYYVAALDPPTGKLNNATHVRTVVGYVGAQCQRKLKLHGELEMKGTTVVQYHSACPDGSEWHGMLHYWNGKLVSTAYHAPAGTTGVQEPYFYSFQIAK